MNNKNNEDIIRKLIGELYELKIYHDKGERYCVQSDIWKERSYRKNLVYYSPKIRKQIMRNKEYCIDVYDDIYFYFIEFYCGLTGRKLFPNFILSNQWKELLERQLIGYNENICKAIIGIYSNVLSPGALKKIRSVEDIFEMEEYMLLYDM